jgi:Protein kinase domain
MFGADWRAQAGEKKSLNRRFPALILAVLGRLFGVYFPGLVRHLAELIRKFEPVSRLHQSHVDILQIGRNDAEGYFYYVMELADDARAERSDGVAGPERSVGVMDWFSDGEPHRGQTVPMPAPGALSTPTLQHANTPTLQDPGAYLPRTLQLDLKRLGRLPPDECLRISMALAGALKNLHDHGLVHRDLKPSNIIFVNGSPKLADIGLVTESEATISYVGAQGFMPPEGPGRPSGDLYSLGKVIYEMCTGRDRMDFPALPAKFDSSPERDQINELLAVSLKACEPDAAKRHRSADEVLADLASGC